MSADPAALDLVRALDAALRGADHHPGQVDQDATGLSELWALAGPVARARAVALLAQRAGDAMEAPALDRLADHMGWPLTPQPGDVLALADHFRDPDTAARVLHAALGLAALVYDKGQVPCEFCLIGAGQEPATIMDERDQTVAIVPRDPVTGVVGGLAPGHWLVLPRVHVPDALAAPEVFGLVAAHAAALAREAGPDALNFITSVGEAATQSVRHLCVDILPREKGDGLPLPGDPYGGLPLTP